MSIPVLVVPILNRPDLLAKMLRSVDHPVDQVVIIDNGGIFGHLPVGSIPQMLRETNVHLGRIDIISLPHNIGCGAAWNLGMRVTPKAPWWFIVNHDIEFGPGDLARLDQAVDPAKAAIWHLLGFTSWAITLPGRQMVGDADENITPAYNEDVDLSRRCELVGMPRIEVGFSGTHVGSATIMSDPILRAINGLTHGGNDAYYARKWGGPKHGGETFTTPFNRGGHVGDWRLEPARLRDQAWPRSKEG